ncbi:MAG: glycosyltransferase family 4 protein [Planctomycetota bacterium]
MRILYVAPRPPYPPEGRETVRPYHQIRFMALRHDVDLICFSGGGVDEWDARERLKKLCHRVQIVPIDTPPQEPGRVTNLFARRPLALRRFFRRDLLRRLKNIGETGRYDLVFVSTAAMSPYLAAFPDTPKVVDLVDAGSLRWQEYSELSRFPSSTVYRAEASRLRQVEIFAAERANRTVFASKDELDAFAAAAPDAKRLSVLKSPVNPRAPLLGPWASDPTILLPGHLDHFPNVDAATRFVAEVFPKIKERCRRARLIIAGKNPPIEIRQLAQREDITVVDRRADERELYREAWVAVAPHRVERGVRNEVLEAIAVGVPVVASPEAVGGLDLIADRDLKVAGNTDEFAHQVVDLLEDPDQLDILGEQGRKAVHNNYSHWSVAIRLEEILRLATEGETAPRTEKTRKSD